MTDITPEMKEMMEWLRGWLNAGNTASDGSPLWNVVAAYVAATLDSVEGGFRGEEALVEARKVCSEYDNLRGHGVDQRDR